MNQTHEHWREYQLMLMECAMLHMSPKPYTHGPEYIIWVEFRNWRHPLWHYSHPLIGRTWGELKNLFMAGEFWGDSWSDAFLWMCFRKSAARALPLALARI